MFNLNTSKEETLLIVDPLIKERENKNIDETKGSTNVKKCKVC
jgi:hypothetical protein